MAKILVMGAGSAQSNGIINCLMQTKSPEEIIGAGSEPTDLIFCTAQKKYLIPHSTESDYKEKLFKIIDTEKPDFIHFQHDLELFIVSAFRDEITNKGVKLFIPNHEDIENCVYKNKSYKKFNDAGIKVPRNIEINSPENLKTAFKDLGNKDGKIWLRSIDIGGGGKGALATNDYDFAKNWIDNHNGWGSFSGAELLSTESVTFLSIWHEGELVIAQTRIRKGWSGRSMTGVTGVTKVGQTYSNDLVTDIALNSINAISKRPHGIFAVDMTYDHNKIPNPTEINIGRFFTTVQFFKEAGLNMPEIYKDIALYGKFPQLDKKINPLKDGLLWLRAMDEKPIITTEEEINNKLLSII